MNIDGIYCDNMHRVYRILPVGVQISTKEIKLSYTSDGLKANLVESIGGLTITKSRGHYIIRLTDYSFLLLDHKNQNDPMVSPDQKFNQCYLILIREKTKTVIKVSKCVTDGSGFLVGTLTGDLLDRYKSDFKNSFKEKEYNTIVERGYGHFEASYELSLRDGGLNIIDNVIFNNLRLSYPSRDVGTYSHRESVKTTIRDIFREEYIELLKSEASRITGIANRNNMRVSPDDRYTFVVNPQYYSGNEQMALIRIDNTTKETIIVDSAMEVEFQEYRIRVRKYSTFLIFFDSYDDIYYNYSGIRIK